MGGGHWTIGLLIAALVGIGLGAINAGLIYFFGIISIVVTIAPFNVFFGLLMFVTRGVSIYALPDWWTHRTVRQRRASWGVIFKAHRVVIAVQSLIEQITTGVQTTTQVCLSGYMRRSHAGSCGFPLSGLCLTPHPRSGVLRGPKTRGKDPS